MENIGPHPKPKLWVLEVSEEKHDISETWGENLDATDAGVQYVQERKESIRIERRMQIEAGNL